MQIYIGLALLFMLGWLAGVNTAALMPENLVQYEAGWWKVGISAAGFLIVAVVVVGMIKDRERESQLRP